ncbi:MAG: YegP family protein [Flavobacteriaceae bacterium]
MLTIKNKGNGFAFYLHSEDGGRLLKSIKFSSLEEVKTTVEKLKTVKENHNIFERKTDHSGKFLFNLNDLNGTTIAKSERYTSEAGMENGIKNVKNRIISLSDQNEL